MDNIINRPTKFAFPECAKCIHLKHNKYFICTLPQRTNCPHFIKGKEIKFTKKGDV